MSLTEKKYPFTQNREQSWLKFNQRVLEEAADPDVALLERLKFIAIFTSNLDEFFQVRCGSLGDLALVDDQKVDQKSGMHPSDQLHAIWKTVARLYPMRDLIHKGVLKTMKEVQVSPVQWKNLNKKQSKQMTKYFETQLKPLLAPQIIDFHHPFPFLINQEQYIFFEIIEEGRSKYGIVPVPDYIDRIIYLNDEKTQFMLAENVIFHNLEKIFPHNKIPFKTIIRVTRNADITLDEQDIDDDEDYRQYMKKILKRRSRLAPVRLEIFKYANDEVINYLCKELHISREQVFISKNAPLDMSHVFELIGALPEDTRTALSFKEFEAQTSPLINPDKPVIPQILDHDVMLFYPYEDIGEFIRLLKEASENPDVLSIKITIYRLAKHSRIVHYLCRAAENGKEVLVLMELRARFDEQNNIYNAERLEAAGCNVIYGFPDYKVHSKIMEITLKTPKGIKTITQIGTGNYNEKTSHQYTDFSFLTSRSDIGRDATEFFKNMAISNLEGSYERLLVSPHALKEAVMQGLDEQIEIAKSGKPAVARFKMNSLTDLDIIAKLAEASLAGVKIDMVIRGISCLLPGLDGITDNIDIHSIVGRYLEHGRIYIFGHGPSAKVYISSADFMTRNTERRVEVAVPIDDPALKQQLIDYFTLQFEDDAKGRKMLSDGSRTKVDSSRDEPLDSQKYFMEFAMEHPYKEEILELPAPKEELLLAEKVTHTIPAGTSLEARAAYEEAAQATAQKARQAANTPSDQQISDWYQKQGQHSINTPAPEQIRQTGAPVIPALFAPSSPYARAAGPHSPTSARNENFGSAPHSTSAEHFEQPVSRHSRQASAPAETKNPADQADSAEATSSRSTQPTAAGPRSSQAESQMNTSPRTTTSPTRRTSAATDDDNAESRSAAVRRKNTGSSPASTVSTGQSTGSARRSTTSVSSEAGASSRTTQKTRTALSPRSANERKGTSQTQSASRSRRSGILNKLLSIGKRH